MCHIAGTWYITYVSYSIHQIFHTCVIHCVYNLLHEYSERFVYPIYAYYVRDISHMCHVSHVLWCHGVSSHVWRTQRRSWVLFGALVIVQMILKILHIYRERRKRHLWWHHHICTSYRNDILYDRKGEQLPPAIASSYLER